MACRAFRAVIQPQPPGLGGLPASPRLAASRPKHKNRQLVAPPRRDVGRFQGADEQHDGFRGLIRDSVAFIPAVWRIRRSTRRRT